MRGIIRGNAKGELEMEKEASVDGSGQMEVNRRYGGVGG